MDFSIIHFHTPIGRLLNPYVQNRSGFNFPALPTRSGMGVPRYVARNSVWDDTRGGYMASVVYIPDIAGCIAVNRVPHHCTCCMSFQFSGCTMALFRIGQENYMAHIYSDDRCRNEWNAFLTEEREMIHDIVTFKPFTATMEQKTFDVIHGREYTDRDCSVCGIISLADRKCFSILVDHRGFQAMSVEEIASPMRMMNVSEYTLPYLFCYPRNR